MELTEDEKIKKYAKQCKHCNRNTSLLSEYEGTCVACGHNVMQQKQKLQKLIVEN